MKRKVRLMIFILILILIGVSIFVGVKVYERNTKLVDSKYTQKDLDIIEEQIDTYVSDKVIPKGMSTIYSKYSGENDVNDIYRGLYKLIDYLPKIAKKVDYKDAESIEKFYEKNSEEINESLKIKGVEKFKKIVAYLDGVGYDGQTFVECEIDDSTYSNNYKYMSFNLYFKFEGIEEFKLKVSFSNRNSTDMLLYYSLIEDEIVDNTEVKE